MMSFGGNSKVLIWTLGPTDIPAVMIGHIVRPFLRSLTNYRGKQGIQTL